MVRAATVVVSVVFTVLPVGTATGAEPRAYQVLTEATKAPRGHGLYWGGADRIPPGATGKRLPLGHARLHARNGQAVRPDGPRASPCRYDAVGSRPRRTGRVCLHMYVVSYAGFRWEAIHGGLYGHDRQRRRYECSRRREARMDNSLSVVSPTRTPWAPAARTAALECDELFENATTVRCEVHRDALVFGFLGHRAVLRAAWTGWGARVRRVPRR
jgi:hypothetical protein